MRPSFFALLGWILPVATLCAGQSHFYIGTYTGTLGGKGIYEGSLDLETGKLGAIQLAGVADNPSFLALSPKGDFLYAALERDQGGVEAFRRAKEGALTRLSEAYAGGSGTCFVSCSADGTELLAANYSSGSVASFSLLGDGSIRTRTAVMSFFGEAGNAKAVSHAHSIYSVGGGAAIYVCDLGLDKIWIVRKAPGAKFKPNDPGFVDLPSKSGPRHLAFDAEGKFVYCVSEFGHSVSVLERDSKTNGLTLRQTVSTLPPGTSGEKVNTAEIVRAGRWLYVSNRGCDTIAVLQIEPEGGLKLVQSVPALVKTPRSFAIDPSGRWLIVAGQGDGRIAELRINPATGLLAATGESAPLLSPACVLFEKW